MEQKKQAVIIFIKNPVLGKVKTRLAKTVGDERALAIYLRLVQHTQAITQICDVDKRLFYSDFIDEADSWDNTIFVKAVQHGNDLGERMYNAFQTAFDAGYEHLAIIGSDCYQLTTDILNEAFEALKRNDVVVGPTYDGGYYLLGMNKPEKSFFENKRWSTDSVFDDTIVDVLEKNLTVKILQKLSDVDEEKDVPEALLY
jgi:rSAM/selenodomain-associated transferase 1